MPNVDERVKTIVSRYLDIPVQSIDTSFSLTDDLGADSLEIVEIVMAFEEEFHISIDDNSADTIVTVGDAVRYLEAVLERQNA